MSCPPIKLGKENESKLNLLIYSIVEEIVPIFRKLNFTPNDITTLSIIFCYLSYTNLKKKKLSSITYYILYVILDYADGYMARMYNMGSDFGDMYDHARDVTFNIFLFSVIYKNIYLSSLFIIGVLISLVSIGCQEIQFENKCDDTYNNTLSILKNYCMKSKLFDIVEKYTGNGTTYVFTVAAMYVFCTS
jgi:phosphatidylserine synthase